MSELFLLGSFLTREALKSLKFSEVKYLPKVSIATAFYSGGGD